MDLQAQDIVLLLNSGDLLVQGHQGAVQIPHGVGEVFVIKDIPEVPSLSPKDTVDGPGEGGIVQAVASFAVSPSPDTISDANHFTCK